MKLFAWTVPLALASLTLPAVHAVALPVEPDYPCYLRTAAGATVDLTAALCGGSKLNQSTAPTASILLATPVAAIRQETAFIKKYKQRAALLENRSVAKMLIQEATENPAMREGKGAWVCQNLTRKDSENLIEDPEKLIKRINEASLPTERQDALKHAAGLADIQILITLAKQGDCPSGSAASASRPASGKCNFSTDIAADGSRCGARAASRKLGGKP